MSNILGGSVQKKCFCTLPPKHTHLGVTLASNLRWDDHINRLGRKVDGYVHLSRILAFRHDMHGMAIRRFFVAFIRPRIEYCSAVWGGASPALLKDLQKVRLLVARAIVRNPTLQGVPTLQQARLPTLLWQRQEHCMVFFGSFILGKVLLHYRPHCMVPCAKLRSTRFPNSFRFPSASSSRHLAFFLCQTVSPYLEQVAFFCHLFTSLFSFRSAVRHYFVSDMFTYGLSQFFSLILFVGFTIFICMFLSKFQQLFFGPCFLLLLFLLCNSMLLFHSPRGKAPD